MGRLALLPDEGIDTAGSTEPTGRFKHLGHLGRRGQQAALTYIGVLTMLAVLSVYFGVSQSDFATYPNLINILETNSVLLVCSIGLTFVMLVGGFDLSIGGVIALSGVLFWKFLTWGISPGVAIVLVILVGIATGVILNGFTIARLGLSFFVVTIAVGSITRSAAYLLTNGQTEGLYDQNFFRKIADGRVAGIPISVVIAVAVLVLAFAVTRWTGFGRMVYVVGGNSEAARLAGINVTLIRIITYAVCSGLAALAGLMEASRLAAAAPNTDIGIELTAAAAVLLGGTTFVGGSGGMFGTFLGVMFLGVLQNGLIIASISFYWQGVITGAVLIGSVLIDRFRRSRSI